MNGLSPLLAIARDSLAGLAESMNVSAVTAYADAWTDMQSVVGAATQDMGRSGELMNRLVEIANNSHSPLQQTVDIYARNAAVLKDLGKSSTETASFTESLNNMLAITATRGERAASVQSALSKAMAVGQLDAAGLETVLANGGEVAQALATHLGTTVGGLQQFAAEGKITGDVIANSVINSLDDVSAKAAAMPQTVGSAFTALNNNLTQFVGLIDSATGASASAAEVINGFSGMLRLASENLDIVAKVAAVLATVITGSIVGAMYAANAAFLTGAARTLALATAISTSSVIASGAMALVTAAATAARVALALLGGPIGLVITALGIAAVSLYDFGGKASTAAKDIGGLDQPLDVLQGKLAALPAETRVSVIASFESDVSEKAKQADDLVGELITSVGSMTNMRLPKTEWDALIERLQSAAGSGENLVPILEDAAKRANLPEASRSTWIDLAGNLRLAQGELSGVSGKLNAIRSQNDQASAAAGKITEKATDDALKEANAVLNATNAYKSKAERVAELRASIKDAEQALTRLNDRKKEGEKDTTEAINLRARLPGMKSSLAEMEGSGASAPARVSQLAQDFKTLSSGIKDYLVHLEAEEKYGSNITKSQKLQLDLNKLLGESKSSAEKSAAAELQGALDIAKVEEQKAATRKEAAAEADKAAKNYLATLDATKKRTADLEVQIKSEKEAAEAIGLTGAALADLERAKLMDAAATLERQAVSTDSNNVSVEQADALRAEAAAYRELSDAKQQRAIVQAHADTEKEVAKESEKTFQLVGDTLRDIILSGGKDAAGQLKNLFSTLVLKPIVQYASDSAMALLGLGPKGKDLQAVLGGKNVGTTVLNNAGALGAGFQAMYGASVGASSASMLGANAVGMMGGDSLGALIAGNGGWAGVSAAGGIGAGVAGLGLTATGGAGTALAATTGTGLGLTGSLGTGYGLAGTSLGVTSSSAGASAIGAGLGANAATLGGGGVAAGAGSLMSGVMAAAPYLAAAAALYSVIKGMDDSGTPHSGAGAIYSQATGVQDGADIYNQGTFGMGHRDEYSEKMQAGISGIAKGLGQTLDQFAVAFGQEAGYTVATAFADDSSKDGSWGSLKITDSLGKVLVNWADSRESKWAPREFADGEDGYKEYLKQVAIDIKAPFMAIDAPKWSKDILKVANDIDTLTAALQEIAAIRTVFDGLGKTMVMFADISADLQTRLLYASGGVQALSQNAGAFYENFFTEQDRVLKQRELQMQALDGLGLYIDPAEGDAAKALFKKTVEDAMNSGQVELAAKLLAMSAAFATTADYAQKMLEGVNEAANAWAGLGKSLEMFSGISFDVQSRLLEAAGGMDSLASSANAFDQGFFSDTERALRQRESQMAALGGMGLYIDPAEGESAKAVFRRTVEEAMASGQIELAAKLMEMSGAFAATADYAQAALDEMESAAKEFAQGTASRMESAFTAMNSAGSLLDKLDSAQGGAGNKYSLLREQRLWAAMAEADYKQQIELAGELTDLVLGRHQIEQESAQKLLDFSKSLRNYVDGLKLGSLSPLTTGEKLSEAAKQYADTLAKAAGGDEAAMGSLQGISSSYLELARQYYASSGDYTKIFNSVTGALDALGMSSQTEAQLQLNVSSQSLDQLRQVQSILQGAYAQAEVEFTFEKDLLQQQVNEMLRTANGIEGVRDLLAGMPAALATLINGGAAAGLDGYSTLAQRYVSLLGGAGGSSIDTGYVADAMAHMDGANWTAELNNALGLLTDPIARSKMQAIFDAVASINGLSGSLSSAPAYVPADSYIGPFYKSAPVLSPEQSRASALDFSSYGKGDGMAAMASEIGALNAKIDNLTQQNERLMLAQIRATVESNEANAEHIVQGVSQATERAAYAEAVQPKGYK